MEIQELYDLIESNLENGIIRVINMPINEREVLFMSKKSTETNIIKKSIKDLYELSKYELMMASERDPNDYKYFKGKVEAYKTVLGIIKEVAE